MNDSQGEFGTSEQLCCNWAYNDDDTNRRAVHTKALPVIGESGYSTVRRGVKAGTPGCLGNQVAGDASTPLARCLALEADRSGGDASDIIEPHRAYRVGVRVATPDGNYGGRWSAWRNTPVAPPWSLPQVPGLSAFWNSAYQDRLAVSWGSVPAATGYHVTLDILNKAGQYSNNLVAMHHTGTWLLVTDRAPGNLQLCPGDRVRMGVRALYEPDVAGPWRNVPAYAWANVNKKDPPNGNCS